MGAILTHDMIRKEVTRGAISITPFDPKNLNPNSYNVRVGDCIKVYQMDRFDEINPKLDPPEVETIQIPEDGFLLKPGGFYLVSTLEVIGTSHYIPMITGRSSIGRYGVSVHQEAGFGDIGFHGNWTFQITTIYPFRLYAGMKIGQIYFLTPEGDIWLSHLYNGKYQGAKGAIPSRINQDF